MKFAAALLATVAANKYESMNEDELLVSLESTLSSAQRSEARGDADAAVANTAAHPIDQDSSISDFDNWKGAQQDSGSVLSSALSSEARGAASRNCGNVPTVSAF